MIYAFGAATFLDSTSLTFGTPENLITVPILLNVYMIFFKSLSREDGVAEVQLGQTHIMCVVSCVLVQPYPDRHNEGILAVYTEFSPMADPTFEVGQLAEGAVELGQIIDRGLRFVARSICFFPKKKKD